jgi:uncharacterized repeat protein (TIGR01451 family)
MTISKALAPSQPATVGIGAPVTFRVLLTNTGDTTITAGSIVDTWSPAYLSYVSAVPSAAATASGVATWTTPAIAPGRIATLTITFSSVATPPAGVTVNRVRAVGVSDVNGDPVAAVSDEASVRIVDTRVSVSKTLSSPAIIRVGETATYTVVVKNEGASTLAIVPLTDYFDDAYLDYSSAIPPPDSTASGSATWNDVTGVGTLSPGSQTTITIAFVATASTSGRATVDTATVAGATDTDGVVAGPVTSTAAVTVLWSARITALSASDAPTLASDVAVTSSVRNDLAIPIADSTITYVIWWDSDSNGTFNAGDIYIDSSGAPHTWDGVTPVSTHVTSDVDVPASGTWTEPTPWTVNNQLFPNQGTYNVTATWRESNGALIDVATTQFYSIPALGWPLTMLVAALGGGWLWRRRSSGTAIPLEAIA